MNTQPPPPTHTHTHKDVWGKSDCLEKSLCAYLYSVNCHISIMHIFVLYTEPLCFLFMAKVLHFVLFFSLLSCYITYKHYIVHWTVTGSLCFLNNMGTLEMSHYYYCYCNNNSKSISDDDIRDQLKCNSCKQSDNQYSCVHKGTTIHQVDSTVIHLTNLSCTWQLWLFDQ